MAVALGLVAHFLVFRPLRNAAPLGKVVASVGLMLYLQGVAQHQLRRQRSRSRRASSPTTSIKNFLGLGKSYPASGAVRRRHRRPDGRRRCGPCYQFTRFGLATRGAAGNEKGAVLLGYSPQSLAAINWVIASVIATLAVIVVGPIQGTITPVGLSALDRAGARAPH